MDEYAIGKRLELTALLPNAITTQVDSNTFEVIIEQCLNVGLNRRSQVLLVRLAKPRNDDLLHPKYLAKCFDWSFCSTDEAAEHEKTPQAYCAQRWSSEVNSYTKLREYQGVHIPEFYGSYNYQTKSGYAHAILLGVIEGSNLKSMQRSSFTPDELSQIEDESHRILDCFHSRGVYHRDIQPSNIFWDPKTNRRLMVCDWEFAEVDPPKELIAGWAASDKRMLSSTLEKFGLPSKGGKPEDDPLVLGSWN
jgi:serine/threonine protein kinase